MVDVVSLCSGATAQDGSEWPIAFVVLFACFFSIDIGMTSYALWAGVRKRAQPPLASRVGTLAKS